MSNSVKHLFKHLSHHLFIKTCLIFLYLSTSFLSTLQQEAQVFTTPSTHLVFPTLVFCFKPQHPHSCHSSSLVPQVVRDVWREDRIYLHAGSNEAVPSQSSTVSTSFNFQQSTERKQLCLSEPLLQLGALGRVGLV